MTQKRTLACFLVGVLLLAMVGWKCVSGARPGFDAYGVYRPAEETAGPGGFDTGLGIENRYYVFQPGAAYLFSLDSPAPPEVPVTTWSTEYWPVEASPSELAGSGLSGLTEGGSAVRKYALQPDGSGDALYEQDGRLWMRMQVGLAAGGTEYVYRLEKLPEEALEEIFGVDAASLGAEP